MTSLSPHDCVDSAMSRKHPWRVAAQEEAMRLFDLVFIACFLIVAILCLRIGWLALRRRREAAFRNLKRLSVFVLAYLAVVIVVGRGTTCR